MSCGVYLFAGVVVVGGAIALTVHEAITPPPPPVTGIVVRTAYSPGNNLTTSPDWTAAVREHNGTVIGLTTSSDEDVLHVKIATGECVVVRTVSATQGGDIGNASNITPVAAARCR